MVLGAFCLKPGNRCQPPQCILHVDMEGRAGLGMVFPCTLHPRGDNGRGRLRQEMAKPTPEDVSLGPSANSSFSGDPRASCTLAARRCSLCSDISPPALLSQRVRWMQGVLSFLLLWTSLALLGRLALPTSLSLALGHTLSRIRAHAPMVRIPSPQGFPSWPQVSKHWSGRSTSHHCCPGVVLFCSRPLAK